MRLSPISALILALFVPLPAMAGSGSIMPQACHITYTTADKKMTTCSGALIRSKLVATAAHCFKGGPQNIVGSIRVGCGYLDKTGPASFSYQEEFVANGVRKDSGTDAGSDVAFLRLDHESSITPMRVLNTVSEFNDRFTVASVVGTDRLIRNEAVCAVAGYGSDPDQELRYHELDYSPGKRTKIFIGVRHLIVELLIQEARGIRHGDSGGPIACRMPGESDWTLIGITSNGFFNQNFKTESGGGTWTLAASNDFLAFLRKTLSEWKL